MKPTYDSIAKAYDAEINERSDRALILIPSASHYLGKLDGLKVLDLACGSGFFTRLIKKWKAAEVQGIDLSSEMIRLAKKHEEAEPMGIRFQVGDATRLESLGSFDVVFAAFLLHYAPSVRELHEMAKGISRNLKEGGRFVSFNENPFHPIHKGSKYDVRMESSETPPKDGTAIRRIHLSGGKDTFTINHFHYEPGTYEEALRSAGLTNISWKPFVKRENADEGFSAGYWDDYLNDFSAGVLLATKGITSRV